MDGPTRIQALFTCLITLQFVVVGAHDWIDVPKMDARHSGTVSGWAAQAVDSDSDQCNLPWYRSRFRRHFLEPSKARVTSYWVLYCAVTLASAIFMWYIPYFLGAPEKTKQDYLRMYSGTKQVLPPRKDNPRPNLLHLCFHVLFIVNFCLALSLRFRRF
jgi:hypothetical protein